MRFSLVWAQGSQFSWNPAESKDAASGDSRRRVELPSVISAGGGRPAGRAGSVGDARLIIARVSRTAMP
ncbi:hypothetical protein NDU88_001984 [Pleurodeles waltl]|uniref:Uncharacterized protein n=1 Tax=Pleurodeles waltl TaxID=8319 RepID=A0AAV7SAJ8_PLEWA|nr:hypothetical protein NDU88_001984 [Pleurodeles waltl]